jgi:photosystem II stability/assembly factor-like uncharacterized protein
MAYTVGTKILYTSFKEFSLRNSILLLIYIILFVTTVEGQWHNLSPVSSSDIITIVGRGNEIYAGSNSDGVFKSVDNGDNWVLVNSGLLGLDITCMLSTGSDIFVGTYYNGLYKLNGTTWDQVNVCDEVTVHALGFCGSILYAGINNSIYSSSDGDTWSKVFDFDKGVYATCFAFYCCTAYAGTNSAGVFVSSDGNKWTKINKGLNLSINCLLEYKQILYAGTTSGIFSQDVVNTVDSSWTFLGGPAASITSLLYYKKNLFAGSDGFGLFRYDWQNWYTINSQLNYKRVYALYNSAISLFAGTMQFGVFKSTDDGVTWSSSGKGIVQSSIRDILVDDQKIYVLNANNNGINQTTDNGTTWTATNRGLINKTGLYFIERYNNQLYVGGLNGLFKSEVTSINWLTTGLISTNKTLLVDGNNFYSSTTDEKGKTIILYSFDAGSHWNKSFINSIGFVNQFYKIGNRLIAAHQSLGIIESDNNGIDWFENNLGLKYADPITVWKFSSAGNYFFASTRNGLYRSSINSTRFFWQKVMDFGADVYDMATIDNKLFVATYGKGMYSSPDYGKSWYDINEGLTDSTIISLSSSSSNLYCASVNGGIFYRDLADLSILTNVKIESEPKPITFILNQNYPNPFNPSTIISYQIPEAGFVQLKIFNLIGQHITTLVDEFQQAGIYHSTFNMGKYNLPSGIYFYKIIAGRYSKTMKMSLMK